MTLDFAYNIRFLSSTLSPLPSRFSPSPFHLRSPPIPSPLSSLTSAPRFTSLPLFLTYPALPLPHATFPFSFNVFHHYGIPFLAFTGLYRHVPFSLSFANARWPFQPPAPPPVAAGPPCRVPPGLLPAPANSSFIVAPGRSPLQCCNRFRTFTFLSNQVSPLERSDLAVRLRRPPGVLRKSALSVVMTIDLTHCAPLLRDVRTANLTTIYLF